MHAKTRKTQHWGPTALVLLLALLLSACGPGNATPTVSVDAIYTAAYSTLLAQQATQLALTPPTSIPTATRMPTLPPPSPIATIPFTGPTTGTIGGGAKPCDSSAFVSDVTIPDDTTIDPGKKFTKTWRLLNNGTCTWGTGYTFAFDSGDQMGGSAVSMPATIAPGATADLSVALTAPTTNGTYKGIWRMRNASNQAFGDAPWVLIKVGSGSTATAGPSPTSGPTSTAHSGILVTIRANVPNFQVTLTNATTSPDCDFSSDGRSCTLSVKSGWTGTVALSKGSYVFTPSSWTFTNVTSDQSKDFTAE